LAIKEAEKNFKQMLGGPFGACIVKGNKVLAVARNTVLANDATCHAEVNAIRIASRKIKNFDLSGCVIYSTTEPCPMCFSAIHWARIKEVVYGTEIKDVRKLGFNELSISCRRMKMLGRSKLKVSAKFLLAECRGLLTGWDRLTVKRIY
jgi:guanine deaminase